MSGFRLTYKDGSTAFIDRAPDSFELRECMIEPVTLIPAPAATGDDPVADAAPQPDICWSVDEENFNFLSLDDLLDAHDLPAGHIVYVGRASHPKAEDLCDAEDVIEMIGTRAWEIGDEHAEGYPDVKADARLELGEFIKSWITKHCPPNFYSVEYIKEHVLTDEDVRQPRELDKTCGNITSAKVDE